MTFSQHNQTLAAQERFARKLTARLSGAADALPYDIAERLRAGRQQALAHRQKPVVAPRVVSATPAAGLSIQGGVATLSLGGGHDEQPGWMTRIASALPLIALVVGLVFINTVQNDRRASELAEVDTAILTDDLPPAAYTDPGFVQFVKAAATGEIQVTPAAQEAAVSSDATEPPTQPQQQ